MAIAYAKDGTGLYYEITGNGPAILFVHEFAGDVREWEPQIRRLCRDFTCIAYNARGYPPSDVPETPDAYSQEIAIADAFAVMDAAGIEQAHVIAHSMGAYTALHLGLRAPGRIRSIVTAGVGWGSDPTKAQENRALVDEIAQMFRDLPVTESAMRYADFPMRQRYKQKDPRGWAEFARYMTEHSALGHALVMGEVQAKRPTLYDMEADLAKMRVPLLVLLGDEDTACLDGSLLLKRVVPQCGLAILPFTGHTTNSEEPAAFNAAVIAFLLSVETGRFDREAASD